LFGLTVTADEASRWNHIVQQFQPFWSYLNAQRSYAGDVAARSAQSGD
jgi:hypothetical protein